MLNFTVGPVQAESYIQEIGYEQIPYFRTPEFSEIMFENERLMKRFAKAEPEARVVFLTGSGTASMEAAVINVFDSTDKLLVINGGSFGQRFVDICRIHRIPYIEVQLAAGENITREQLRNYDDSGITGVLVNVCETSTGVRYDLPAISEFCCRNGAFLVVDAISSFMADPFDMQKLNVDIMITGSQKALACPPGISIIVLSEKACERVNVHNAQCLYLDLKIALKNGDRGQTPFTPAVGILRQIHARMKAIERAGGVEIETKRIRTLAYDFRKQIKDLPFEIITTTPSNCVTPLRPLTNEPSVITEILKKEYEIWVCPNGGELGKLLFRVGHLGALSLSDNTVLVNAFKDLQRRGII